MRNMSIIHDVVMEILENEPNTRNSDMQLYSAICKAANPDIAAYGFCYVLNHSNELGIPKYETVTRARRKIQAEHPDLQASDEVRAERKKNIDIFVEYAKK